MMILYFFGHFTNFFMYVRMSPIAGPRERERERVGEGEGEMVYNLCFMLIYTEQHYIQIHLLSLKIHKRGHKLFEKLTFGTIHQLKKMILAPGWLHHAGSSPVGFS